jgi:hypothetical protein
MEFADAEMPEMSVLIDVAALDATLDLWCCMWQPEEQTSFETALVRSMTNAHPRPTRLQALAACHIIATPRLLAAAARVATSGLFTDDEITWTERETLERHKLLQAANNMRGNVLGVEQLLGRVLAGGDALTDGLLDWVDLRDLVAVARTTIDARLFAEIERRISRRGKYQRGRAANVLGFSVRVAVPVPVAPVTPVARLAGGWQSHSPEIGDFRKVG